MLSGDEGRPARDRRYEPHTPVGHRTTPVDRRSAIECYRGFLDDRAILATRAGRALLPRCLPAAEVLTLPYFSLSGALVSSPPRDWSAHCGGRGDAPEQDAGNADKAQGVNDGPRPSRDVHFCTDQSGHPLGVSNRQSGSGAPSAACLAGGIIRPPARRSRRRDRGTRQDQSHRDSAHGSARRR